MNQKEPVTANSGISPAGTVYAISGPRNAVPLIFIHGLGLNRAVWQWQVPAFATTHRTLVYDLLGHGDSPAAGHTPSLRVFSDQLAELMACCGLAQAVIVGFSLGGMIARRFAQDHPQKTRGLIILNSPHRRSAEARNAVAARLALARRSGPAATVDDALMRWFTPRCHAQQPELPALARRWLLANDARLYPLNYAVLVSGVAEIIAPTPPLTCPTLVITGADDIGNGPDMARAIAADIPGARTVILQGLRHMALMEQPDAVNRPMRRFLDTLASPRPRLQ